MCFILTGEERCVIPDCMLQKMPCSSTNINWRTHVLNIIILCLKQNAWVARKFHFHQEISGSLLSCFLNKRSIIKKIKFPPIKSIPMYCTYESSTNAYAFFHLPVDMQVWHTRVYCIGGISLLIMWHHGFLKILCFRFIKLVCSKSIYCILQRSEWIRNLLSP